MSLRVKAGVAAHLVFAFTFAAIIALGAAFFLEQRSLAAAAAGAEARAAAEASLTALMRAARTEGADSGPMAAEALARFEGAVARTERTLAALETASPDRAPMLAEAETALAALAKRFPAALEARALAERLRRDARARLDAGGDADAALRALLSRDAEARRLEEQSRLHQDALERSLIDATATAARGPMVAGAPVLLAGAAGIALTLWLLSYAVIRASLLRPVARLSEALAKAVEGEPSGGAPAGGRDEFAALAAAVEKFRESAGALRRLGAESAAEAAAQREQIEALLQGLRLVNDAKDSEAMYAGLLAIIARLAPYDAAAILLADEGGAYATVAASEPGFAPRLSAEEIGEAPAEGLQTLEECDYRLAAKVKGFGYRSALIAPLGATRRPAMILCARRGKDGFGAAALGSMKAFAPVAEQALRGAEQLADLESAVDDLDAQAHHCSLTGLKNRQAFHKEMDRRSRACAAWEAGAEASGAEGPFALLHIDLDHFKAINDAMGHAAGDHALVWAARVVQKTMRRRDFVARLGGDEFAVICDDDFEEGELQALGDKLVQLLSRPFDYEGKTLQMGASIGIGRFPADADDPDQILHIADMALLDAKADGRGRCAFFNRALRREMERRQILEKALRGALADNQIELWHQPIVDLKDRRVAGIEAQIRWECPRLGVIEPEEFLPVAEHAGMLGEIGEWALRRACADLGGWAAAEPGRRIAVGVSGAQLGTPDFAPELEKILEEQGLRPHMLELLTSASVAMGRSAAMALRNLSALRERGFLIAFDDFGQGPASLEHLRPFAGQRVKLPARFIAEDETEDAALAEGLVALARSLGLRIAAKGVAREAQLGAAQRLGCEEAQGHLFGRPAGLKDALIRAERLDEGPGRRTEAETEAAS